MSSREFALEVWGPLACFTGVLSVERHSMLVPPPSCVRNIFDAIYVKPSKFRWQVKRVEMLQMPSFIALRRNEVKNKAPGTETVLRWMDGRSEPEALFADGDEETTGSKEKGRTQRQTIALKNVRYRLTAQVKPWPGFEEEQTSFECQAERHFRNGQTNGWQPYFGMREFPAFFELSDGKTPAPIKRDIPLGWMVYDTFDLSRPGNNMSMPSVSLFLAEVKNGVLEVPDYESDAVHKPVRSQTP